MFLKNPRLKNNLLVLQPRTIVLLGGNCSDLQEKQEIRHTKR